jgi:biotin carboxyl carrier protein
MQTPNIPTTNSSIGKRRTFTHAAHLNQTLGKSVDQQVLQIVSDRHDEKTVRSKFVQLILSQTGVVGAGFIHENMDDQWMLAIKHPSSGRLPSREFFNENGTEACSKVISSTNVQFVDSGIKDMKLGMVSLKRRGAQPEILIASITASTQTVAISKMLQTIARALTLWLDSQQASDAEWQVIALSAVIDMIGKIENRGDLDSACEEAANLLANRIGCGSVAVGWLEKGRMNLKAISGVSKIDHGSEASRNYVQALVESSTRKQSGLFPAANLENNHLLQAHKQLAAVTQSDAVMSVPLFSDHEEDNDLPLGAIVFTGERALIHSNQVARFGETAAPAIAGALKVVSQNRLTSVKKVKRFVKRKISRAKRVAIVGSIIVATLLMFVPIKYRVRCNCVAEAVSRRFAVAPFAGQIISGHKEIGDVVKAGDLLAEMDGRTIRWELSGVEAEREQSLLTRESELFQRNIPKAILAELEFDRLEAQKSVLKYQRDNLDITSPVDGVVLSGSLERAEAASVETGQVLFEIGPTKPLKVEIAIPDDEVSQIKVGHPVKIWIDGQESDPITGEINQIHPRSETRNADNVFIAEIEFANEDERLRPGMKGSARIDGERRPLGWCLFHKPVNWLRSRLTWW